MAHPDRTTAVIYLDAAMDHASVLKQIGALGDLLPSPPNITREERADAHAFREYYRRTMGVDLPIGEVLALTVPGPPGMLSTRTAPRVSANIVAATVAPEFARVNAPTLALYSESTTEDAFPWLPKNSPEYARADAMFAKRLRTMVLAEREQFARAAKRAQLAAYRAHHYLFLSHPDETEERIRAFLSSLALR